MTHDIPSQQVEVIQADRDFADMLAREGPSILRGIHREHLSMLVACYRLSAPSLHPDGERETVMEPALPAEAIHLDGCEHTHAPVWICQCPRPVFRFPKPEGETVTDDGWVMVPREPSERMLNAAHLAAVIETGVDSPRFVRVQDNHARAVWAAMLAVSPKPQECAVPPDGVEVAAISLIVDLCGAGASQSATNVRVVEDHLRQFARSLYASPKLTTGASSEEVEPIREECRRIVREYGADRPDHQLQCLMIPMATVRRVAAEGAA